MSRLSQHPGKIPTGTLRAIIREAGVSMEEFLGKGQLSPATFAQRVVESLREMQRRVGGEAFGEVMDDATLGDFNAHDSTSFPSSNGRQHRLVLRLLSAFAAWLERDADGPQCEGDIRIYSQDATRTQTIQVKTLSQGSPVPLSNK